MATITTSNQYSLNKRDWLKGLLITVFTPIATLLLTSLEAGSWTFNWKQMAAAGLAAGIVYLMKNFLAKAEIIIDAPPSQVQAVKDGEAVVTVKNI